MLKIVAIEIMVRNLDKAIKWYKDCLQAKITEEYKEWKCVDLFIGKSKVELDIGEPLESWGEDEFRKAKSRIGSPTGIIIQVDDIEELHKNLQSKGARFTQPPTRKPWGEIVAIFVDLDGNEYKLMQEI
jgi:predicted enzyme related to lactoylglutathione lyase